MPWVKGAQLPHENQPQKRKMPSCPDLGTHWFRERQAFPRAPGERLTGHSLPTLLYELLPPPRPLGELLCVGLLDACPLVQAAHEVAAQAMAIVDPLHRPLVVPDLGDRVAP